MIDEMMIFLKNDGNISPKVKIASNHVRLKKKFTSRNILSNHCISCEKKTELK